MIRTQLQNDYKRDPEGFTYNLVGNAVAYVGVSYAVGKTFNTIKPGVKFYTDSIAGHVGGVATKAKQAWKSIDWDRVIFEDHFANQLKQIRKIDFTKADDIGEFITKSGSKGYISFKPVQGAHNSIWQEFRSYMRMKHDFKHIPALPDDLLVSNPRIARDIKTFLKHRSEFLVNSQLDEFASFMDDAIAGIAKFSPEIKDISKVTKWDEMVAFWKAKGYIVNPEVSAAFRLNYVPPSALDHIRAYWKMARTDAKGVSKFVGFTDLDDLMLKFGGTAKGKGTPLYKVGMGMKDIPWPSTAEQFKSIKFFKDIFSDAEFDDAMKFFLEMNKQGVTSEIAAFTKLVRNAGVEGSTASNMIGEYAVALTAIYMAEHAVTPEAARQALQDSYTAIMGMASGTSTAITTELMAGALLDIQSRINYGIVSGQITGLEDLSKSLIELRSKLDTTGKLDPAEMQKLYLDLMNSLGLDTPVGEDLEFPTILKTDPYTIPDVILDLEPLPPIPPVEPTEPLPPTQIQRLAQKQRELELRKPGPAGRGGRIRRPKGKIPEKKRRKPKLPKYDAPQTFEIKFSYFASGEKIRASGRSWEEAYRSAAKKRKIPGRILQAEIRRT